MSDPRPTPQPPYVPPAIPPGRGYPGGQAPYPQGHPPQGAYGPPQGAYGPAYGSPVAPYAYGPPAPAPARPALGIMAFVAAIIAAVVASIVAGIACYYIGVGVSQEVASAPTAAAARFDLRLLTPVRDWVLLGEIAFWVGTVCGVWAIVQGIIAIAKRRGRGWGIAAVITAAAGPFVFFAVAWGLVIAGVAATVATA